MAGRNPPPSEEEMRIRTERSAKLLARPTKYGRDYAEDFNQLPASVDLTTIGRVSPAKNQGNCQSCSIFAAVSTIESCIHKVTNHLPTDLSEQGMLDCAYGYGHNSGCSGGLSTTYHQWMHEQHN